MICWQKWKYRPFRILFKTLKICSIWFSLNHVPKAVISRASPRLPCFNFVWNVSVNSLSNYVVTFGRQYAACCDDSYKPPLSLLVFIKRFILQKPSCAWSQLHIKVFVYFFFSNIILILYKLKENNSQLRNSWSIHGFDTHVHVYICVMDTFFDKY